MADNSPTTADRKASIFPVLSVRNGAEAMAFYMAAFGAKTHWRIDDGGSNLTHLAVGSAEFWLADESPEYQNFSPATLGGSTVCMVMVVEDPDAVFEQAVAAGATVVEPLLNWPYPPPGWRIGRIVDPYGHQWEIRKPIAG